MVHVRGRGSNHLPTIHTSKTAESAAVHENVQCCKHARVQRKTVACNGSSRSTECTLWQGLVEASGRATFARQILTPSNQPFGSGQSLDLPKTLLALGLPLDPTAELCLSVPGRQVGSHVGAAAVHCPVTQGPVHEGFPDHMRAEPHGTPANCTG